MTRFARQRAAWVLGAAFLAQGGCDRGKDDDPSAGPAVKLVASEAVWEGTNLTIGRAKAHFYMTDSGDKDPLFMNAYFEGFPGGTKIRLGDRDATTDRDGYLALDIDMAEKVGALPLRTVSSSQVDLELTVVIEAPGSELIEEKLPGMRVAPAVAAALARVRDGAVTFAGEPESDGVSSVAMVSADGISDLKILGSADKVRDLDWVAVKETRDSGRTRSCGGYKAKGEEIEGEIEVAQMDALVKIYERRTGKVVAEESFQPKNECPSFAMISADKKARARVLDSQIEPWVRDTLEKARNP